MQLQAKECQQPQEGVKGRGQIPIEPPKYYSPSDRLVLAQQYWYQSLGLQISEKLSFYDAKSSSLEQLIHSHSILAVTILESKQSTLVFYHWVTNCHRFSSLKHLLLIISQFYKSDVQGGSTGMFCLGSHQEEVNILATLESYLEVLGGITGIHLVHLDNLPILRSPH